MWTCNRRGTASIGTKLELENLGARSRHDVENLDSTKVYKGSVCSTRKAALLIRSLLGVGDTEIDRKSRSRDSYSGLVTVSSSVPTGFSAIVQGSDSGPDYNGR